MEPQDEEQDAGVDPRAFVDFVTQSENLVDDLTHDRLTSIGRDVVDNYDLDHQSMSDWLGKMEKAIELATLVKGSRDYPFKNASNIKYPLVTSAALQFNARAYPAIVPSTDLVKVKVWGEDPGGMKAAKGERVGQFMSYQLTTDVEEWERETDKLLVQLPIVGDMFRKVWHDGERPRCKLMAPGAFVVNAKAQNISDAPRCSEFMRLFPHEIRERINTGFYVDFELEPTDEDDEQPFDFIEQHLRIDLDEDGYAEPYIATVYKDRNEVVRLVADFDADKVMFEIEESVDPLTGQKVTVDKAIARIPRSSYFVHYQFMPGMDDGIFGTGLGILLGDISKVVNSTINMLLDAGHYASLGGGFIGEGFRIKGGAQRMAPGEWRTTQSSGDDIRKSLVPMTYPGPNATLYEMLGLLLEAGKEISSTKDIMTGDTGGKVQTATTTLALIEQGMKVFTAAYKRIFRSLRHEFALFAKINAETLSPEKYNAFFAADQQPAQMGYNGGPPLDPRADFSLDGMDIQPVADPNAVTKMQEMAKAQLIMDLAGQGMVDPQIAAMRILEAAAIADVEELLPRPNPVQQQMEQMGIQAAQADLAQKMAEVELTLAKVQQASAAAYKDVAGVESELQQSRFEAAIRVLEMTRDDLAKSIEGSRGGVEGESGDGSPAIPARVANSAAQTSAVASLLAG